MSPTAFSAKPYSMATFALIVFFVGLTSPRDFRVVFTDERDVGDKDERLFDLLQNCGRQVWRTADALPVMIQVNAFSWQSLRRFLNFGPLSQNFDRFGQDPRTKWRPFGRACQTARTRRPSP